MNVLDVDLSYLPHDQGSSHSTTRCEQSNQNVLLTSQGWCIFDWLPNFHVECFMYLCQLSSSIHLFVVHFVTCHHLLTSQRFCSHKLFLLVSFFFLFLNIYPNVWHDLHTFPSHLPQLNLSTWQTSTLEHIYSFSCHWHFLFLAYKCQQVRSNGKRHERLIPQYQHQL